jgi:hypothetical protein
MLFKGNDWLITKCIDTKINHALPSLAAVVVNSHRNARRVNVNRTVVDDAFIAPSRFQDRLW